MKRKTPTDEEIRQKVFCRLGKKLLAGKIKLRYNPGREFSKPSTKDFRTGGVQAQNGAPFFASAGLTLRPVGSEIGENMGYSLIDDDFWTDPKIADLPFEIRGFYNYLIHQSHSTGFIYKPFFLLKAGIGATLGISMDELFAKGLATLCQRDRIGVDEGGQLIFIKNRFKRSFGRYKQLAENQAKGFLEYLNDLPKDSPLLAEFVALYWDMLSKMNPEYFPKDQPLANPLPTPQKPLAIYKPNPNPNPNPITKNKNNGPTAKNAVDPNFKTLQDQIYQSWKTKTGQPPNWGKAEGQLLKTLLGRFEPQVIADRWCNYLNHPDWFAQQNGQSFRNFYASFDKIGSRPKEETESERIQRILKDA